MDLDSALPSSVNASSRITMGHALVCHAAAICFQFVIMLDVMQRTVVPLEGGNFCSNWRNKNARACMKVTSDLGIPIPTYPVRDIDMD
jgi:hypothetical protein